MDDHHDHIRSRPYRRRRKQRGGSGGGGSPPQHSQLGPSWIRYSFLNNVRTHARTDGRTDGRTNERTTERTYVRTYGRTYGRTHVRMDVRTSKKVTNHFLRRTNKRPEILADLITGSTNPGTFNRILRKAVFWCFWTLRSFKI